MSNYRLTARAIIIEDRKILLNEFNNGEYYNLPGGGVEKGETLREAVEREVLEESGYSALSRELLYVYEYNPERDGFRFGKRGGLSHVFICDIDHSIKKSNPTEVDQDPNKPSNRATGIKWIDISKLNDINLIPKINHIVMEDYINDKMSLKFLENIH